MAFFIKYEFWYNYLHILRHRNVPVYSVSSIFRPDQVFFKWYGRQYGRVLNCFTHFFVQNEQSRDLLAKIHITNVSVVGDTRFDRVLQIKEVAKQLPIVEAFVKESGEKPKIFVAGSSWPPDEEIFIRYFKTHREWKLIIAPHVIGEDHLKQIEAMLEGFHVERYTKLVAQGETASLATWKGDGGEALIIDCFGLLSSIYHYGDVAYVGGGFGVGIHNLLEAAVWNVPVFFGPNNQKFQEAQGLKQSGGFEINNYEDFERQMNRFASDASYLQEQGAKAGQFVKSLAGATEKVMAAICL
jgi:3-deoxy-D-manno-octulosonic-acid transferase